MVGTLGDAARTHYQQARTLHWDDMARSVDTRRIWAGYYHRRLAEVYRFLVTPGQRVLEIGCGLGDLLAAVEPTLGVGVDLSAEMIRRAAGRHPQLRFAVADAHALDLHEQFDAIILSDLLNDVWDVQTVFEQVARIATPQTRIIINTYSRLWEPVLRLAETLGVAKPNLDQNWLTKEDTAHLLDLAGLEMIKCWPEVLWPIGTPLMANLFNRFLVRLWPLKWLALTNFIVARPKPAPRMACPSVSIIVPARNEAGNVSDILARVPQFDSHTEVVFVEGHSSDDTYETIRQAIAANPACPCRLYRQTGTGKGDAVRLGFAHASGDVLMILDADLTMPPEYLPRFRDALCSGRGEFINGVRLVYPMEGQAMRFANLVGNKLFSMAFSWLLGQPVKDTLCGTKVLWKSDYERIAANRAHFGDFDPFGDFDLLFGAAKLNLRIIDLPVRYRERVYGTTNIQRWRHGWLLLKMALVGARRLKFV